MGIGELFTKLEGEVVSVIGTGGTGGYIVDLVAKTPVREIRQFDADEFLQHNSLAADGVICAWERSANQCLAKLPSDRPSCSSD